MNRTSVAACFQGQWTKMLPRRRTVCNRRGVFVVKNVFTGIVQGRATVRSLTQKGDFTSFSFHFPEDMSKSVSIGSSVALNGACLTATSVNGNTLSFDAIGETLSVTNLSDLQLGSEVNYEKAARFGDEVGGHNVSGHVHTVAEIKSIETTENNCRITFALEEPWMQYIFSKGYVAVDGVSLTVCEASETEFSVYLIPETLRVTTFQRRSVGDLVNIEVESQTQVIVDTVERIVDRAIKQGKLSKLQR